MFINYYQSHIMRSVIAVIFILRVMSVQKDHRKIPIKRHERKASITKIRLKKRQCEVIVED